ncbi:MAG: GAF domain-containing protein [Anaerolineaceae bacterium]|nr:GAF domain-containing protein [Anaerolineaceae bacterium]
MMDLKSAETLEILYGISRDLATALDLHTTLERVLLLAVQYVEADRGSIVVLDVDQQPVDAALAIDGKIHGNAASQFQDVIKRGLIAWVIENRQPAFINNTIADDRWLKRSDDQEDHSGAKSAMCLPLVARNQLVGVLTIVHPLPDYFSQEHFQFLQTVADQAGVSVHNALLYDSLESMHRQYYELFEDSIVPILITDSEGSILQANRAAYTLIGRNGVEPVGKQIFDYHRVPFNLLGWNFEKLYSGDVVNYESSLQFGEEIEVPVRVFVRMLPRDAAGRIQWIIQDITDTKQLETMRHDLLAMVYHDIRSPLSNVISSLELLRMMVGEDGDQNIETIMSIILRSTNRIQRLVSNLLDIDRLESGQKIAQPREVNVSVLAEVVSEDVRPTLESRNQHYHMQIEDNIQNVWADEDMLRRVLINLLENAAKYTPTGGAVTLKIETIDARKMRFTIADTGPGIELEAQKTLFEKFTRVNPTSGPKGIGLGLSFCKMAVEAHEGEIWIESKVGDGSKFIFELPLSNSDYF